MSRVYSSLTEVCWALGVLSLLAGVILKFVPILQQRFGVDARSGLIFAGTLFLCALATEAMERAVSRVL